MLLRDRDAVMKALSLNDVMFKKVRKLRVTVCGKRTKRGSDGGRKRDAPSSGAGGAPGGSSDSSSSSSSSGGSGSPKAPKKEKKVPQFKVNRDNAKKRINLKSANTRNKVRLFHAFFMPCLEEMEVRVDERSVHLFLMPSTCAPSLLFVRRWWRRSKRRRRRGRRASASGAWSNAR